MTHKVHLDRLNEFMAKEAPTIVKEKPAPDYFHERSKQELFTPLFGGSGGSSAELSRQANLPEVVRGGPVFSTIVGCYVGLQKS